MMRGGVTLGLFGGVGNMMLGLHPMRLFLDLPTCGVRDKTRIGHVKGKCLNS